MKLNVITVVLEISHSETDGSISKLLSSPQTVSYFLIICGDPVTELQTS